MESYHLLRGKLGQAGDTKDLVQLILETLTTMAMADNCREAHGWDK